MSHNGGRRTRPLESPQSRGLSPDRVVALALAIIDKDGLDGLNMRRLAADAGVKPMSLYHHFPSKRLMLDAVADAIAGEALALPPEKGDWRDRTRFLFAGLHTSTLRHPRALPLIATAAIRTPNGRRWMDALMRALLDGGFTADEAAGVYHMLGAFTLGFGYAQLLATDVSVAAVVGQLAGRRAEYPSLLSVGLRLMDWDRPDDFTAGFEALLASAIERRGSRRPADQTS
jgi:AcrR family transcriptional regulator